MIWLLMIVLNPLATRMLTTRGSDTLTVHALRFGFYSLLQVISGLTLLVASRRLTTRHLRAGGAPAPAGRGLAEYGATLSFALSIPVFFVTTYGWVLWIAGPFVTEWLSLRRRPRATEGA